MKKYFFPYLLCFIFLFPLSLESKQIYVKMNFGLFTGGNVTDSWQLNPEYYDYTITKGERTTPGLDFSLEFIFQIHPNIGLSLGTGYISRNLSGSLGQFTSLDTNEVVRDFSCSPGLSSEMIPVYLTAIFSFPVSSSVQINFLGGAGYYLGDIKGSKIVEIYQEYTNPSMIANRLIWKFESKANAVGYHGGMGVDVSFSSHMDFSFEALYKAVDFKDFKVSVQKIRDGVPHVHAETIGETGEDLGGDTTFFYVQKIKDVDVRKDIDYRITHFKYSGISFRAGLKFKF